MGVNAHYYNTTNQVGTQLQLEIDNARTQEQKVAAYFKWHPNTHYTPFEIMRLVFSGSVPVTSVRRAMTNLTGDGVLIKTDVQKAGDYGKPCYTWKYNDRG